MISDEKRWLVSAKSVKFDLIMLFLKKFITIANYSESVYGNSKKKSLWSNKVHLITISM